MTPYEETDPFADEPLGEAQVREIERRMNINRLKTRRMTSSAAK